MRIDTHVHTRRYSGCSQIDPVQLVQRAERVGLDGLVITEHQHQWTDEELDGVLEASGVLGFVLLSGFEYSSAQGDILVYGLKASQTRELTPGLSPEKIVERANALGGVCVAAHPTRGGMAFDERVFQIPFAAIEVCSSHLNEHEQRLARRIALTARLPGIAGSDAHSLEEVGCYATDFQDLIMSMADLQQALRRGRFRPATVTQGKVEAH